MADVKFLEYITSRFSLGIVTFLSNLSLFLGNIILFYIFEDYFNIPSEIWVFIIGALLGFLFIGRIYKFHSYLWFLSLFVIFKLNLSIFEKSIFFFILLILPLIIFYIQFKIKRDVSKKEFKLFPFPEKLDLKMLIKFLIVLPRILFFNVSYFLFPLLIVWLGYFGVLGFLKVVALSETLGEFTYLVSIIGIIFGFFQYYTKRQEEKVQNKIVNHLIKITFQKDCFSFESFIEFLKSKKIGAGIINKCENIEKGELKDLMRIAQVSRMPGKEITQMFLNIQLPQQEDKTKFILLETEMKKENRYKDLVSSYSKFFEEKKKQLLNEIDKKEINELTWLLLSNINLLDEAYASLFTFEKPKKKPKTYDEFLIFTQYEILDKVISEMVFN